jgi:hypothetical protein
MKRLQILCIVGFLLTGYALNLYAQANFSTSLHATRAGKNYWYGADTTVTHAPAPGFEILTGVPITHENVACALCHPGDNLDANGNEYETPYPGASCVDCHATESAGLPVTVEDCLGCHGRQVKEVAMGFSDVHSDTLKCWDCHTPSELHGDDGVEYNSMLEPGAIKVDCDTCHSVALGTLPDHSQYDPHGGKIHCDACHTQSVIACYNCHFESQVESHVKRAQRAIGDFVILVNRDKDNKVGTATFQSLSYEGNTWVALAPYHAHTTTAEGRNCADCHANIGGDIQAINEYNENGEIKFATWNSTDSTLEWVKGVVPLPEDYQTSFKMDFITYNGDPSDPPGPSKNWSTIGEDTWDGHQMFFATPLTKVQMSKLGFDTTKTTGVSPRQNASVPKAFTLKQNYPNPFNPATTIEFTTDHATKVTLNVYSVIGTQVATLMQNKKVKAGTHQIQFRADNLSSGVYIYTISTPEFSATKKMILMK